MRHSARALVALIDAASLAAACGGEDAVESAADVTSEAPPVDGDVDVDAAFPVTIEHKYGSTTIEDRYASIRTEHPEFVGATSAVAFSFDG
jgi:iron complex transport system substrate-binding protein